MYIKEEKHTGFLLVCLSIDITLLIERHLLLTLGPSWEKNLCQEPPKTLATPGSSVLLLVYQRIRFVTFT